MRLEPPPLTSNVRREMPITITILFIISGTAGSVLAVLPPLSQRQERESESAVRCRLTTHSLEHLCFDTYEGEIFELRGLSPSLVSGAPTCDIHPSRLQLGDYIVGGGGGWGPYPGG